MGRAILALAVVAALVLAGCGKSGRGAETDAEKGSDVEYLNAALAQELVILDAYARGRSTLNGRLAPVGRRFLGQQQEYVDAITKAIRGLGGEVDVEPPEPELPKESDQKGFLTTAYELESGALTSYMEAAPHLNTAAPRTLAAALAAGHAQHLVVLRQGLGAGVAESVPEAFDGGEVPPPAASPNTER
jgi:hypothetical protein